MIAYLEGEVIAVETHSIVIKTVSGVGYDVHVTDSLIQQVNLEETASVHVFTNVREDAITLFGFAEKTEKTLFEMLIKTSGVGPKLGIAIISTIAVPQIINAAQSGNANCFSQVSGIGKKTAAKLCLDMKDQLKKKPITGVEVNQDNNETQKTHSQGSEVNEDTVFSALKNMGFLEKEISSVLKDIPDATKTFEERFKKALSLLSKLG